MCLWRDSDIDTQDVFDISESWSFPGKVEDMLNYISDWPVLPKIKAVVEKTPPGKLSDFKLLWRDPLKSWISKGGRIMLIGDAAHVSAHVWSRRRAVN